MRRSGAEGMLVGNGGRGWLLRGERGSEMDETSMARGMEVVRMDWAV